MNQSMVFLGQTANAASSVSSSYKNNAVSKKSDNASDFKNAMKKAAEAAGDKEPPKQDAVKPEADEPKNSEVQKDEKTESDQVANVKDTNDACQQADGSSKNQSAAIVDLLAALQQTAPTANLMTEHAKVISPMQTIQGQMAAVNVEVKMANGNVATAAMTETPQQQTALPQEANGADKAKVASPIIQKSEESVSQQQKVAVDGKETEKPATTAKADISTVEKPGTKTADVQEVAAPVAKQEQPDVVKIKVGEGTANTATKQFPQEMAQNIKHQVANGKNEFDIQLMPKELGMVKIKLVFEAGAASILMTCTNQKAQQILTANAEQIKNLVQQETGFNTTVEVKEEAAYHHRESFDEGNNDRRETESQAEQRRRQELETALYSQQFRMGFRDMVAEAAS